MYITHPALLVLKTYARLTVGEVSASREGITHGLP